MLKVIVVIICCVVLGSIGIFMIARAQMAATESTCDGRFYRVLFALQESREFESRQPQNIESALCWRVKILPFLGYDGTYNQFNLHQRWDSLGNRPIIRSMPPEFLCPAYADVSRGISSYWRIEQAASESQQSEITERSQLELVENWSEESVWTDPRQFRCEEGLPLLMGESARRLVRHPHGPAIGLRNLKYTRVPSSASSQSVNNLCETQEAFESFQENQKDN